MIELKQVSKIYKAKSGETAALRKISIKFAETGLKMMSYIIPPVIAESQIKMIVF